LKKLNIKYAILIRHALTALNSDGIRDSQCW